MSEQLSLNDIKDKITRIMKNDDPILDIKGKLGVYMSDVLILGTFMVAITGAALLHEKIENNHDNNQNKITMEQSSNLESREDIKRVLERESSPELVKDVATDQVKNITKVRNGSQLKGNV